MTENEMSDVEIRILKNDTEHLEGDAAVQCNALLNGSVDVINAVLSADYDSVIKHELFKKIFSSCENLKVISANDGQESTMNVILKESVEEFLCSVVGVESEMHLRKLVVLCAGIACLQIYVRNNWVGPPASSNVSPLVFSQITGRESSEREENILTDDVQNYLNIDGDCVYGLSNQIIYLYLARILLNDSSLHLSTLQTSAIWLLRCLHVHQQLLEDRAPSLKRSAMEIIDKLEKRTDLDKDLQLLFHVEAGHIFYFYYEPARAVNHFLLATKAAGLNIELTGALGKRTRFQTKEISQLMLQVNRIAAGNTGPESSAGEATSDVQSNDCGDGKARLANLPKDLSLSDETVLEHIELAEPNDVHVVRMNAAEQALLLGLCYNHERTREGQSKIVEEEVMAYINCVLSQPINWCVQTTALLMRARWEKDCPRRLHRALQQLEEVVNQFKRADNKGCNRLPFVHTVALPPHWAIERELGSMFKKIGAMSAALDVYLALHSWEEVIECYAALGHCEKAERLIQDQLAIKPTPSLYCYLGDVTHKPEHYETAWTLSGKRNARAQRCLAYYYLRKHDFERSLHYFEKTLEINPLQTGCWFSLGCAYLSCLFYDKAAVAFRRCVDLDNDNHEAWSNLATAYIKSNNKPRAFVTIQEALKWDYDNWKIWENYILIAADVGDFGETMRAYHRLLELRHKHTDVEVLTVLVKAIKDDLLDYHDQPSRKHKLKALDLFGHITSKVTTNGDIWRLYAELLTCSDDASDMDRERALQYLQKSQRCAAQVKDWEVNADSRKTVCQISVQLANAYLESKERLHTTSSSAEASQYLSSARLMLKGVIAKLKKQQLQEEGSTPGDVQSSIAVDVEQMEALLKLTDQ